jgi:hypothetical protein
MKMLLLKRKHRWFAKALVILLLSQSSSLWGGKVTEHEPELGQPNKNSNTTKRTVNPVGDTNVSDKCGVSSGDIAKFANGESYNFGAVLDMVTNNACAVLSNKIVPNEIGQGINFNKSPFHLDEFAKGYSNLTIDGKRRVESGIQKTVENGLRNNPLSDKEILPVLGQLALLSPKAARSTLAYLITQELISQELEGRRGFSEDKDVRTAVDTVSTLKKFGADEPLIVTEIANRVEEMATSSQADSLGKVLTGLALAAREVDSFSAAFNSSAGAFSRGVKQSAGDYSTDEKGALLKAGFSAATASVGYNPSIEPGSESINEALKSLLGGQPLSETSLKNVWRKVVEVTAVSPSQTALAQALALSLTSSVIYLPNADRDKMLEVSKNHPVVAGAIQELFLEAWNDSRQKVLNGKMKVALFNSHKEKFFTPWVSKILDLEIAAINPMWVKEVVDRGLVKDEEIQSKFPRFVLAFMGAQENSSKKMVLEGGLEARMETAMTSFNVLWSLSSVYIPTLEGWAKRHEED